MPHLDHKGPEGKGRATGRGLGLCKNKKDKDYKMGEGMAARRKAPGDIDGNGRRLKSGKIFENK